MPAAFLDDLYTYAFSRDTSRYEEYPPLIASNSIPPIGKIG
jgi:hypothetical protein